MNRSAIVTALGAMGLMLGAAQNAQANVYAESSLQISGLSIVFNPAAGATPGVYNFTATNTAVLNGASALETATCGGTFGGASTCPQAPITPVLNPLPANAPGSTVLRADGSMIFFGPGAQQYANSDSEITTAQLAGHASTSLKQIAEAELQTGTSASANAEIQSTTGFTFTFQVAAPGSMTLSFQADPDQLALISELLAGSYSAQTNMRAQFTLQQDTDTLGGSLGFATWQPQGNGIALNDCTASNGVTCAETADTQDLNTALGVTTNGQQTSNSREDALTPTAFSITVSGLDAGTWTLTLNSLTSVNLIRQVATVPEPGSLALLGACLFGMGYAGRRMKSRR